MNPLPVGLSILGGIVVLAAAVKAGPVIWGALCVFGRINDKLDKLDKLDSIEDAANEARDEWKGATASVNRLVSRIRVADDHEIRLSSLEHRVDRLDGKS